MNLLTKVLHHLTKKPRQAAPHPTKGTRILVMGLAKSGTSILMFRIAGGLEPRREYFEPRGQRGQIDLPFHQEICQWTGNVITKIVFQPHLPHALDEIFPLYDRIVWIIRDPRDQLISSFFYSWFKGHNPNPRKFQQALACAREKEAAPATVPFHTLSPLCANKKRFRRIYDALLAFLKKHHERLFIIRYEDFIDGNLDELETYLGFPLDQEAQVRRFVRRVSRSRASGNWRRWFTPEDVEFYQPKINPYLAALGYAPNDWALQPVDSLPAKEGSEYMKRMFAGG